MSKEQGWAIWESVSTPTILSRAEIMEIMIFNLVTGGYGEFLAMGATRLFHPTIDIMDFAEVDDMELRGGD